MQLFFSCKPAVANDATLGALLSNVMKVDLCVVEQRGTDLTHKIYKNYTINNPQKYIFDSQTIF